MGLGCFYGSEASMELMSDHSHGKHWLGVTVETGLQQMGSPIACEIGL